MSIELTPIRVVIFGIIITVLVVSFAIFVNKVGLVSKLRPMEISKPVEISKPTSKTVIRKMCISNSETKENVLCLELKLETVETNANQQYCNGRSIDRYYHNHRRDAAMRTRLFIDKYIIPTVIVLSIMGVFVYLATLMPKPKYTVVNNSSNPVCLIDMVTKEQLFCFEAKKQ